MTPKMHLARSLSTMVGCFWIFGLFLGLQGCGSSPPAERPIQNLKGLASKKLLEVLSNEDEDVRLEACRVLGDREEEAWVTAKGLAKTNFALKHAIEETDWITPRYIEEGLRWLAGSPAIEAAGKQAAAEPQVMTPESEGVQNG